MVSRDDSIYEAWPDIEMTSTGKLICIFTRCNHHSDRDNSQLMLCESMDRGKTWSRPYPLTKPCNASDYWNNGRIKRLSDESFVIVCDKILGEEKENKAQVYMWKGDINGKFNFEPIITPVRGIVPDKLLELKCGRWLIAAHCLNTKTGKLEEGLWYSDNKGETWSERIIVASDERYNLCEASLLELPDGTIVAFMRENSGLGFDCMKSISYDMGESFHGVYPMPIPACHRPVSGLLNSGKLMISYRFMQGGKGWLGNWTQNFFAAITDINSVKALERKNQSVRIMPVDYDRSPVSDLGYSGWVQYPDGEIYMVNYIVDDAPMAQIRGYSFYESDFIL